MGIHIYIQPGCAAQFSIFHTRLISQVLFPQKSGILGLWTWSLSFIRACEINPETIEVALPELLTHCNNPDSTVHQVLKPFKADFAISYQVRWFLSKQGLPKFKAVILTTNRKGLRNRFNYRREVLLASSEQHWGRNWHLCHLVLRDFQKKVTSTARVCNASSFSTSISSPESSRHVCGNPKCFIQRANIETDICSLR